MRIARLVFAGACACAAMFAQAPEVAIYQGGVDRPFQAVYGYSGTNLIYTCYSPSSLSTGQRVGIRTSMSAATNANPVVFTSTHAFNLNSRPIVTISGGTGNWAAVNGTFTATPINSTTFSIPVDSTAFGALAGTLVFTTTAPRLSVAEWAVVLYAYDGSNNLISRTWLGGTSGFASKCSDATSTSLNVQ